MQDVENMLEAYSLQADYFLAQLSDLSQLLDSFQVRPWGCCQVEAHSCNYF
jgi:hypothetical protein